MTLLTEWQAKPSWNETLPICPVYISKASGRMDISLARLCMMEKELTLNPEYGFEQFSFEDPRLLINPVWRRLAKPTMPFLETGLDEVVALLSGALISYLEELWDPNIFHLVFCSAGLDSRNLSWRLAELRDRMGKDWIGDIHFRCHEPEGADFKKAMARQGWKPEQYSVWKEGQPQSGDCFDMGNFQDNINAYSKMLIRFSDDVVPPEREKETCLVLGMMGGEGLQYPLWQGYSENRLNDLYRYAQFPTWSMCREYNRWGDILMPYLSYKYLDILFRVPRRLFRYAGRERTHDVIRKMLLERFHDPVPCHYGHQYGFYFSETREDYIRKCWRASRLYNDYSGLHFVRCASPWLTPYDSQDAKLYSYATMYETIPT